MLVILWCLSAAFWDMARFINQSFTSYFQAQADYTCLKDPPRKFCEDFYIKWTLFISSKNFFVVMFISFWLLASKKK